MESPNHNLNSLFQQLGLDNSDEAIDSFITQNNPLAPHIALHEASIWNPSQSAFLKQALEDDADWAMVVDQLDTLLR